MRDYQKIMKELYDRFMPDLENQEAETALKQLLRKCIKGQGDELIQGIHKAVQIFK